jgi:hypothetical protein
MFVMAGFSRSPGQTLHCERFIVHSSSAASTVTASGARWYTVEWHARTPRWVGS